MKLGLGLEAVGPTVLDLGISFPGEELGFRVCVRARARTHVQPSTFEPTLALSLGLGTFLFFVDVHQKCAKFRLLVCQGPFCIPLSPVGDTTYILCPHLPSAPSG